MGMLDSPQSKTQFRSHLLRWFDENQRDLPWRHQKTPYRIWVSEIMLQQTQVATVVAYYQRFMEQFPTVETLAVAEQADVLKLWEGLGYYRRARQMHAAAQKVVEEHGGRFPETFDDVLALPGVGRYTAGAILSIALDQKLPILEGNTIRLFARLMELKTDPRTSGNQKQLWSFSESLLPRKRAGDFNQALMELGSEICHPKRPKCLICPVKRWCPTQIKGLTEQIPVAAKKVKYEDLDEAVVIVVRRGKFLVRTCGPGERWEGLWDFPRFKELNASQKTSQQNDRELTRMEPHLAKQLESLTGLSSTLVKTPVQIKHAVTRYRIRLSCYLTTKVSGRLKKQSTPTKWMNRDELDEAAMSITGRKMVQQLDKILSTRDET